jgi:hypothetical protein
VQTTQANGASRHAGDRPSRSLNHVVSNIVVSSAPALLHGCCQDTKCQAENSMGIIVSGQTTASGGETRRGSAVPAIVGEGKHMSHHFGALKGRKANSPGQAKRSPGVTGMARRSEVSASRRKSCPGALTKGIRHRWGKGTDLEYQGEPGPVRASGDPRGGVRKKP